MAIKKPVRITTKKSQLSRAGHDLVKRIARAQGITLAEAESRVTRYRIKMKHECPDY